MLLTCTLYNDLGEKLFTMISDHMHDLTLTLGDKLSRQ